MADEPSPQHRVDAGREAKSLDRKLAAIHADPGGACDFIIADAKDADMAFGIAAPGRSPEAQGRGSSFRSLEAYRQQIRQIVTQAAVDIMLMSASTNERLTIDERLFDDSPVTPAARSNDTSDIFIVRGGRYPLEASRPFRTATLDHIQCGRATCDSRSRTLGADLGLYSITFNNRLADDLAALEAYKRYRLEAERRGFRHFLEVFDPNDPLGINADQVPAFVNDHIARTLAGVTRAGRPIFLKVVYHGPKAMEELVSYDPHLVVGILGGGAGTTYDAFKLISEAQKYGARVALFGRKINNAEHQLAFVRFLRLIVDGSISPEEAVRGYHATLKELKIKPHRSLADDLSLETNVMSYSAAGVQVPAGIPSAEPDDRGESLPTADNRRVKRPAVHKKGGLRPAVPGTAATSHMPENVSLPKATSQTCHCGCGGACGESKVARPGTSADGGPGKASDDAPPDFAHMTPAERLAYHRARLDRMLGRYGT